MRTAAALLTVALFTGCDDGPGADILVPLPDTVVVGTIELRMQGRELTETTETRVYVDRVHHTGELIDNSLPDECDDECNFVIAFAGASIPNGPHIIGVTFFAGEEQLATDAVSVVISR